MITLNDFELFRARVAQAGLIATDRGNGHWQIRKSATIPAVLSWWPASSRSSVFITEVGARFRGVFEIDKAISAAEISFAWYAAHPERPGGNSIKLEGIIGRHWKGRITMERALAEAAA